MKFRKNLIVWKQTNPRAGRQYKTTVSEGLNSVETGKEEVVRELGLGFQKDL